MNKKIECGNIVNMLKEKRRLRADRFVKTSKVSALLLFGLMILFTVSDLIFVVAALLYGSDVITLIIMSVFATIELIALIANIVFFKNAESNIVIKLINAVVYTLPVLAFIDYQVVIGFTFAFIFMLVRVIAAAGFLVFAFVPIREKMHDKASANISVVHLVGFIVGFIAAIAMIFISLCFNIGSGTLFGFDRRIVYSYDKASGTAGVARVFGGSAELNIEAEAWVFDGGLKKVPITKIDSGAFDGIDNIEMLILPENIIETEDGAFDNSSIKRLTVCADKMSFNGALVEGNINEVAFVGDNICATDISDRNIGSAKLTVDRTMINNYRAAYKSEGKFFVPRIDDDELYINFNNTDFDTQIVKKRADGTVVVSDPYNIDKPRKVEQDREYQFIWWTIGSEKIEFPYTTSENLNLFAEWRAVYKIDYNINQGAALGELSSEYYDTLGDVIVPDAERDGYTFMGWFDNAEFKGNKITLIAQTSGKDFSLHAKFLYNYSISYDAAGGTQVDNPTFYHEESDKITLVSPTRRGYDFVGWYNDNDKITAIETGSVGDLALTARWKIIDYKINYFAADLIPTLNADNRNTYNVEDDDISLSDISLDGYTFLGWFLDAAHTDKVTGVAIEAGSIDERSFYAHWALNDPTIVTGAGYSAVYDGASHSIEVGVSHAAPTERNITYSYQWIYNDTTVGTQSEYAVSEVAQSGIYKCRVTATDGTYASNSVISNDCTVSITRASYNMSGVKFENATVTYNGSEQRPTISGTLPTGADGIVVTVSYSNGQRDKGSKAVTATFSTTSQNYNVPDPMTATVTVGAKDIADDTVISGYSDVTYKGSAHTFTLKVTNSASITANDYDVAYADNTNAGTATITLTGKGNFSGTKSVTFKIEKKKVTAVIGAGNKVYDGDTTATLDYSGATFTGIVSGDTLTVTATGAFTDKNAGTGKTVNISGITLGGADVGNYALTSTTATALANITRKEITAVNGITASNKVYNGNTTATLDYSGATFTGIVSGDTLTVTATGAFTDKNAGTGKTVNISGITLGGADVGNYALTSTTATALANITRKEITAVNGITASNKVYDGNTTATLDCSGATFTGIVSGDTLTVTATGAFTDKNAGTGKTVNISGITLGGADVGNYALTSTTATALANITRKEITAVNGITASNKVYNGNTTATLDYSGATFTGIVSGDTLRVKTAVGTFANKNVGTSKTVTISVSLEGADVNNYILADGLTATTQADILQKDIADDTVISGYSDVTYKGSAHTFTLKVTNSVSITANDYDVAYADNINAGTATITLTGKGNFSGTKSVTFVINKASYNMSGVKFENATVTYNGSEQRPTISGTLPTGADGIVVTVSYSNGQRDKGSKAVTATFSTTSQNYNVPDSMTATVTVGAKDIADDTVVEGYRDVFYNGSAHTFTLNVTNIAAITVNDYDVAYADNTNAGTATITLTGKGNFSGTKSVTFKINCSTVSRPVADNTSFTYNGAVQTYTIAESSLYTVNGNKQTNAGTHKVTVALNDAANYIWNDASHSPLEYDFVIEKANITNVTLSGVDESVIYNGSTHTFNVTAVFNSVALVKDVDFTVSYDNRIDVGMSTVTIIGKGNNFIGTSTVSYEIEQRTVTAVFAAVEKVYDGDATASFGKVTFDNIVASDNTAGKLSVSSAVCSFDNKNVGKNKTVTITEITLGGSGKGNYKLSAVNATTTGSITPKNITAVTGITASNKTYDGNTMATLDYSGAVLAGKVSGDDLDVTANGEFIDKNAGTGKTVNISGITLLGADAGNYSLTNKTATASANILPKSISGVSVSDIVSEVYTGSAHTPNFTVTDGAVTLVQGSDYTIDYADNIDVGEATITITGVGNYDNEKTVTFSITPQSVSKPSADSTVFTYSGEEQTYTVAANNYYTVSGNVQVNAGTHYVTVSLKDTKNYCWNDNTIEALTFEFVIDKVALTVTAGDEAIVYGDDAPEFSVTFGGFVSGETEEVLDGTLEFVCAYEKGDDVGEYAITPNGLTSVNYELTFIPGKLTVEQKTVDVPVVTLDGEEGDETYSVAESEFYDVQEVEGEVGKFIVTIKDAKNYKWSDGDGAERTIAYAVSEDDQE